MSEDGLEDDDEGRDRPSRERRAGVSDFVRRAIENTVGSVQSTVLSKEALQYLLQQGDRGRREVLRIIAGEVGQFLRNTDLSSEIVKILTAVEVDLNVSIKFRRSPEANRVAPDVEVKVSGKPEEEVRRSNPPPPDPPSGPPEPT